MRVAVRVGVPAEMELEEACWEVRGIAMAGRGSGGMDVRRFGESRGGAGNNSNFAPEMNRDVDTGVELEVGDGLI